MHKWQCSVPRDQGNGVQGQLHDTEAVSEADPGGGGEAGGDSLESPPPPGDVRPGGLGGVPAANGRGIAKEGICVCV